MDKADREFLDAALAQVRSFQTQTLGFGALLLIPALLSIVLLIVGIQGIPTLIGIPMLGMGLWWHLRMRWLDRQEDYLQLLRNGEHPEQLALLRAEARGEL